MFSLILYLLCVLVFLLVLAFLVFTGYLHYVHWKYSHIPQPKRPRYTMICIILIMHVCMHTIIHAHAITTAKYLLKSMATIWIVNYSSQKQSLLHDFSHFFRGVWFFFFFFFFNYSIMEWLQQSWFRWKFSWQCEKWMGHVYLYNCMHYTCPMTIVTIRLGQSQWCTTFT